MLIAVLADGAGSAAAAGEGAEIVVNAVVGAITATMLATPAAGLTKAHARAWLDAARTELETAAASAEVGVREFASTLLAAVVSERGHAFLQIGDGVIVVRGSQQAPWNYAFWPDHGEYANVTRFVTDRDAQGHMEFSAQHGTLEGIFLMSDGLERLALDFANHQVHARFFDQLVAPLTGHEDAGEATVLSQFMEDFLDSARINELTDDDKSIIIATRGEPANSPALEPEDARPYEDWLILPDRMKSQRGAI